MRFLTKTASFTAFFMLQAASLYAESGSHGHGNPHPDLKLVFQEINFIILLTALVFLLKNPLRQFFAHRSVTMKQSVEKSREFYEKALEESRTIQAKLAKLEEESRQILVSTQQGAEEEARKIVEQSKSFAEKIDKDARRLVQSEISKANEELKDLTIKHIQELAHEYIKKEINEKDEEVLVKKFIERLQAN